MNKRTLSRTTLLGVALMIVAGAAFAGTPNDPEFAGLATRLTNWVTGNLAIGVSLAFLLIGAVVGLARITAMPMLTSVVIAIVFSLGATVLTGIIGAVI
jgi:hypothetical protein